MQRLKMPTISSGSQVSPRESGTALRHLKENDPLPRISSRSTDVEIPNRVWSSWIPRDDPRRLVRALTLGERAELEERRDELAPALVSLRDVVGFESVVDEVVLAIMDMFGSYRSMRQTSVEAMALAESTYRAMCAFPAWAVVKVCGSIQLNGVWRDGKFDRQWAPNDSEVAHAVRLEIAFYEQRHRETVALLSATVEER